MKLTLLVLLLAVFQGFALSTYGQNTKLTLKMENATIKQVLNSIEEQTDFFFLYNSKLVNIERNINIDVEEQNISDALKKIFTGTDINYEILNRQILLSNRGINMAQSRQTTVKGQVLDSQGLPLPGVTVIVKGTTTGTITDIDGSYQLDNLPENAVLIFSFVGMKPQEIPANKSVINITLQEETIGLEEVVAIGYGTMKKSDITGAISSVSENSVRNEPIQRMEQMLQGRVSGVAVTTTSGAPDGNILIRVRGANSINGGNDPLYIVDGVANKDLFSLLDVNDIQSIEVLKDASATAIYGSRGANGVILVTTKKGSEGKFEIQFETQQSIGTTAKEYDMLNAVEFANFYNQYRKEKGASDDFYSEQQINGWNINGGYDWQDLIFQNAYTQNYKLSVSGGTQKVKYLISGNVRDAEGILIESKFKKYGIRANIDAKTFDWLSINFQVNGAHNESTKNNEDIGVGGIIWDALTYSPTVGLYDEDGDWLTDNVSSYYDNPYGRRVQDKDDIISNYFGGTTKFTFKLPIKGLTLDILGSANYMNKKSYILTSAERKLHDKSEATNNEKEYFNWQNTNQLTYTNTWGMHSLTATVVAEYTKQKYTNLYVDVNDLLTESVGYWNLGLGSVTDYGNEYTKSTLASYIGRIMYQLNNKYLFTTTVRRDGSSKFQGDNKWGYFPSFAFAWRASDESFINKLNIFDQFKIRASWGITGNQGIEPYSTLGMLSRSNYSWGTSTAYPGYWAEDSSTPDLSWEKTYQWDAGFDLGFFKNRLIATIDLYLKNTKDLLLEKAIPYYDGGGSVYTNVGHVRNKGLEFSLNIIPIKSNTLTWESTINVAYSKNKVINMGGDERLFPGDFNNLITFNPSVLQVGKPMGSIWGYTWEGLWSTNEAEEAAKYGQKPGDNKFMDKNQDYTIDSNDQGIIGKAFPDYTFGWNNTVSWKNFEFNLFFQGAVGAGRLNLTRYGISEAISDARFVTSKEGYYDMWTINNQNTDIPNIYSTTIDTNAGSTQYLESADFLRLKNFSIGYNVPIKSNNKISKIKISASIQNLFTITSYSGYDPEVTSSDTTENSDTEAGIEQGAYPVPRTYTLGLRVSF